MRPIIACRLVGFSSRLHSHTAPAYNPNAIAGAVKQQPALEGSLRSLLALRAAGWKQPASTPSPDAPVASAAASAAAADAAADALASQLTLSEPAAAAPAPAPAAIPAAAPTLVASPAPAAIPAPRPVPVPAAAPALTPAPQHSPAPLAAAPAAAPVPAEAPPALRMPDEWDYLAPAGAGVFGPFSMEQLRYWVEQGHLEPGVQVRGPWRSPSWGRERKWRNDLQWQMHVALCLDSNQRACCFAHAAL